MLESTMLKMATNDRLQCIPLPTAVKGSCAASPGYPTEFPALNPPPFLLVLARLGISVSAVLGLCP